MKRQYEPIPPLKLELKFLCASIYLKAIIILCIWGYYDIQFLISYVDYVPI